MHYNLPVAVLHNLRVTLEMIKWEHSIFALPFALCGAMLAAGGLPTVHQVAWIIVAMIAARSAAMAFNRWADAAIDAANPRTSARALPAGHLTPAFVVTFVVVSSALFILAASQLNRLALLLSPVALAVLLLYSYTKRFTALSHWILGWCLSIAPSGAWIAIQGKLTVVPLLLSLSVMLWTAGFDILYACQDYDFDRRAGLYSIPRRFGISSALWIARAVHALMFCVLVVFFIDAHLGWLGLVGVSATGVLLVYQHSIVKSDDLSRLNAAFFTTNAFVSVILFVTIASDALLIGK